MAGQTHRRVHETLQVQMQNAVHNTQQHSASAIRALADVQAEEQISSLHNRLNDDGLIGRLTRKRLIALQARSKLAALVKRTKHSLINSVCEAMADRNIAFHADLSTDLNVTQGSLTIAEWGGRWISDDTLKTLSERRIF
ncbi:unnamed protein product [Mortierella alpina]